MQKLLLVSIVFACTICRGEGKWVTDLPAALKQAAAEKKAVLVDFTGSDWCGWCIKLKKEVFDQREFQAFANENLVLVEIDFPRKKTQADELRRANKDLLSRFAVEGFPTVFILDANGNQLLKTGYNAGGARKYIEHLMSISGFPWRKPKAAATATPRSVAPKGTNNVFAFTAPVEIRYDQLALKGISTGTTKTALINNQNLAAGEKARVKVGNQQVSIVCKEIRESSVLVQVEGEAQPRELKLKETDKK